MTSIRTERHLQRQRGAGTRELKSSFGFTFGTVRTASSDRVIATQVSPSIDSPKQPVARRPSSDAEGDAQIASRIACPDDARTSKVDDGPRRLAKRAAAKCDVERVGRARPAPKNVKKAVDLFPEDAIAVVHFTIGGDAEGITRVADTAIRRARAARRQVVSYNEDLENDASPRAPPLKRPTRTRRTKTIAVPVNYKSHPEPPTDALAETSFQADDSSAPARPATRKRGRPFKKEQTTVAPMAEDTVTEPTNHVVMHDVVPTETEAEPVTIASKPKRAKRKAVRSVPTDIGDDAEVKARVVRLPEVEVEVAAVSRTSAPTSKHKQQRKHQPVNQDPPNHALTDLTPSTLRPSELEIVQPVKQPKKQDKPPIASTSQASKTMPNSAVADPLDRTSLPAKRKPLQARSANLLSPPKVRDKTDVDGTRKRPAQDDWAGPSWFKASVPDTLLQSADSRLKFRF